MKAMLLREITQLAQNQNPLSLADMPEPKIGEGEILLRVTRCGVCHTELDEVEGRTPPPHLPVVLGHQVVGVVEDGSFGATTSIGADKVATTIKPGQRVGVAWIASACGHCQYCISGQENLCAEFKATGRDINGGYAEYMKVRADFVHLIPESISDSEAAPLLCAGAVGYRALRLSNLQDGQRLGLMGFGGSNHIVLKTAKHKYPGSPIFVFSRNPQEREFALSLGADWAGAIDEGPPEGLDAVIDTTPVWGPISEALKILNPGGRLVINAIRKEESDKEVLLKLDYPSQLWMEKEIKSVANVTRQDVREFLQLAAEANIKPEFQEYELKDANETLLEMKQGKIRGAKVLRISEIGSLRTHLLHNQIMPLQTDPERKETKYLHNFAEFADKRVIEIGCGEGRLTWQYANKPLFTIGIDLDADALRVATIDRPFDLNNKVLFSQAESEHLPFRKETFDIALLAWSF